MTSKSTLTQPSSGNSGSLKNCKRAKKASETVPSATDLFNVHFLSFFSWWHDSIELERNHCRPLPRNLLPKLSPTSNIVFIVCQYSADQTTQTRPQRWSSIPRSTCPAWIRQMEKSRTAQCSKTGNHNTQLRQFCKSWKRKCLQTKSLPSLQKEPCTEWRDKSKSGWRWWFESYSKLTKLLLVRKWENKLMENRVKINNSDWD